MRLQSQIQGLRCRVGHSGLHDGPLKRAKVKLVAWRDVGICDGSTLHCIKDVRQMEHFITDLYLAALMH